MYGVIAMSFAHLALFSLSWGSSSLILASLNRIISLFGLIFVFDDTEDTSGSVHEIVQYPFDVRPQIVLVNFLNVSGKFGIERDDVLDNLPIIHYLVVDSVPFVE